MDSVSLLISGFSWCLREGHDIQPLQVQGAQCWYTWKFNHREQMFLIVAKLKPLLEHYWSRQTTNVTALICNRTWNFSDLREDKISKISESLKGISTSLDSESKPISEAKQSMGCVGIVTGLEVRLCNGWWQGWYREPEQMRKHLCS